MNKINYLKDININFNNIKRLTLEYKKDNKDRDAKSKIKNNFETLFSFSNIENNLIYLDIKFIDYEINNELFENINNFKILKNLYLENFNFHKNFTIKLNELKLLSIIFCKNIKISEVYNKNEKISKLNLSYNRNLDIKILEEVYFKELKELNLSNNEISDINILEKANFKVLKELDLSNNEISNIIRKSRF